MTFFFSFTWVFPSFSTESPKSRDSVLGKLGSLITPLVSSEVATDSLEDLPLSFGPPAQWLADRLPWESLEQWDSWLQVGFLLGLPQLEQRVQGYPLRIASPAPPSHLESVRKK